MIYLYGLGLSNLSLGRVLAAEGTPFRVWDDRPEKRQEGLERFPDWTWFDASHQEFSHDDTVVLSPGVKLSALEGGVYERAQKAGAYCCCDVDVFLERLPPQKKVIGVTGTNGKSTVVSLLGHVLKELGASVQVGGNIGVPVFDMAEADIYVLELSSFQLQLMHQKKLAAGLLLNITPDHLDHHASMDEYSQAKAHLFDLVVPGGIQLISEQTPFTQAVQSQKKEAMLLDEEGMARSLHLSDLPAAYQTGHHLTNALSVWRVLSQMGEVSWRDFTEAATSFQGLPHRQHVVACYRNIQFVDDSKATNMAAALKALEAFDTIYWLVGGIFKEERIPEELLAEHHGQLKGLYCFGRDRDVFYDSGQRMGLLSKRYETLDEAFEAATTDALEANEAATVLLSPCCASFDQFSGYAARGDHFKHLSQKKGIQKT